MLRALPGRSALQPLLACAAYDVARWPFYRRYEHYLLGRVINATLAT
ncbi:hypothetical protein GCM10009850_092550 [Nonomuraea monospora]|uniref:Uncharacterized protein n=1 Tax=Nonomuraea monospora TaxID=568818 RepID=A0ABP5PS79_9ACTN